MKKLLLLLLLLTNVLNAQTSQEPSGLAVVVSSNANKLPIVDGLLHLISGWDGVWGMNKGSTTVSVNDLAAPCSPPGTWKATYSKGWEDGVGPVTLWAQRTKIPTAEYKLAYIRVCLKIGNNGLYENQSSGTKLMFINLGDGPTGAHCSIIPRVDGDGGVKIKADWRAEISFECFNVIPNALWYEKNTNIRPIKSDKWQVHEYIINAGDIDKNNGYIKWYIDGTLAIEKYNILFRTAKSNFTHKVYKWKWAPTWGGNSGQVKTRVDYYYIDDIYMSGSP